MAWETHARYVRSAVDAATAHLLAGQSQDGFWRDYDLPPGASEAWTTAWVAWCLARRGADVHVRSALQGAMRALTLSRTPAGWGYNRGTEADADSTAWAIRALATRGAAPPGAGELLSGFLDVRGAAHTFPAANDTWGGAHPDVTAMVGLAMRSLQPSPGALRAVRAATLAAREPGGAWRSFWWATDSYATAWSLRLLDETGGIPATVASDVRRWLQECRDESALALAHGLIAALSAGASPSLMARLVDALLEQVSPDGGFVASAELLVPARRPGQPSAAPGAHRDVNGLVTTAIAAHALSLWEIAR